MLNKEMKLKNQKIKAYLKVDEDLEWQEGAAEEVN